MDTGGEISRDWTLVAVGLDMSVCLYRRNMTEALWEHDCLQIECDLARPDTDRFMAILLIKMHNWRSFCMTWKFISWYLVLVMSQTFWQDLTTFINTFQGEKLDLNQSRLENNHITTSRPAQWCWKWYDGVAVKNSSKFTSRWRHYVVVHQTTASQFKPASWCRLRSSLVVFSDCSPCFCQNPEAIIFHLTI